MRKILDAYRRLPKWLRFVVACMPQVLLGVIVVYLPILLIIGVVAGVLAVMWVKDAWSNFE